MIRRLEVQFVPVLDGISIVFADGEEIARGDEYGTVTLNGRRRTRATGSLTEITERLEVFLEAASAVMGDV